MAKSNKSWEKRLCGDVDQLAVDFVESLSYDNRLYKYDIAGSIAHARMLADQKLISKKDFAQIKKGLVEISDQIDAGKFRFNKAHEDIHMAVESALVKKIGDVGKKLHTGRSRNDQVATDMRLWMRDKIEDLQTQVRGMQKALVKLAAKYAKNIMPSYTHLQRAQPIVIGAQVLSFVEQLERDHKRLGNCSEILNVSPLGSGAVAGSTLPLDRKNTAKQLGFAAVMRNSMDGVADRDFCAEFIFDCSMVMTHLSRLAEDWIIYSTNEFGFLTIDDKYCTSSSMMPQKRNPDMLELIRGKTGSVFGSLTAMLTILKALPSTYNRDLQEDKLHIFNAADVTSACLAMATAIVANTKFNTKHIAAGIDEGFLGATALAEYIVNKGVPFREAHGVVGGLVAKCEKGGIKLSELELKEFKAASAKIGKDVYKCLSAVNIAKAYKSEGAAGMAQVQKQIDYWKKQLK